MVQYEVQHQRNKDRIVVIYLAPADENSNKGHETLSTRIGVKERTRYRLGTFRDGVLRKLTREDETHRSLDFAGGYGGLLRVGGELCSTNVNVYA